MMSDDPQIVEGQRVLGVVPGKPAVGDEKVPSRQKLVFVWPHLLVRHAVAALAVLFLVLVIALIFNAPLKDIANPAVTPTCQVRSGSTPVNSATPVKPISTSVVHCASEKLPR